MTRTHMRDGFQKSPSYSNSQFNQSSDGELKKPLAAFDGACVPRRR